MQALVLERQGELSLRDIAIDEHLGDDDVRIAIHTVGICGSDIHYYQHGRIGDFVVDEPMVLGHEAAGTVVEVGSNVRHLTVGDRVCMEPGIADPMHHSSREGAYNLEPGVRFWATPPVHGVLRPFVVHPAHLTFKLPDIVSFAEGAMVEPLAVGVHAVNKAGVRLGDSVVVLGAGTIGVLIGLAARAAGASTILMTDIDEAKLAALSAYDFIGKVDASSESVSRRVLDATDGRGATVVFEASGSPKAAAATLNLVSAAGTVVFVGMPQTPISYDVVAAQTKEVRVEHVFRYANVFDRTVGLLASGQVNVVPLVSRTYSFRESVEAFEYASSAPKGVVKVQVDLNDLHSSDRT